MTTPTPDAQHGIRTEPLATTDAIQARPVAAVAFPLAPATRVRLGVAGFACSLSLLTYLDRICIMRVKENIQNDLCISQIHMGWVFGAFALGYALFEVPGGWMGDRWGARRVITRIVLWWSIFTVLTGSIDQLLGLGLPAAWMTPTMVLAGMLLVRFLFGCGEAGAYPNLARVTGSWFPFRERALVQGAIWMCARLGGAIAPLTIGRLTEAFGWRQAFWILGMVGVVWCIAFWAWFRDTPEEKPTCNEAERDEIRAGPYSWKPEQARAGHAPVPWRLWLTRPTVWALYVAAFCVSFAWYFYPTWQPQYLKDVYHIEYRDSEILTGLPFLCGAAGSILGGRLSDVLVRRLGSRRWGRSGIGVFGFTGAGLCVLATGFVPAWWQAVGLLCLAFFINDLAIPAIWAVSTDIGGRHAGTLAGSMNMIGAFGAVLAPVMTPVLRQSFEWSTVFIVLATFWFIGAAAWLGIDASKPLVRVSPPEDAEPGR